MTPYKFQSPYADDPLFRFSQNRKQELDHGRALAEWERSQSNAYDPRIRAWIESQLTSGNNSATTQAENALLNTGTALEAYKVTNPQMVAKLAAERLASGEFTPQPKPYVPQRPMASPYHYDDQGNAYPTAGNYNPGISQDDMLRSRALSAGGLDPKVAAAYWNASGKVDAAQITGDARIASTDRSARAREYSSDRRYEGVVYKSDNDLKGTKYKADKDYDARIKVSADRLKGTQYEWDARSAIAKGNNQTDLDVAYVETAGKLAAAQGSPNAARQGYKIANSLVDSRYQAYHAAAKSAIDKLSKDSTMPPEDIAKELIAKGMHVTMEGGAVRPLAKHEYVNTGEVQNILMKLYGNSDETVRRGIGQVYRNNGLEVPQVFSMKEAEGLAMSDPPAALNAANQELEKANQGDPVAAMNARVLFVALQKLQENVSKAAKGKGKAAPKKGSAPAKGPDPAVQARPTAPQNNPYTALGPSFPGNPAQAAPGPNPFYRGADPFVGRREAAPPPVPQPGYTPPPGGSALGANPYQRIYNAQR